MPKEREGRIWNCDDAGYHYVHLTAFEVGSMDQVTYLSLSLYEFADFSLLDRIKSAWRILRHGKLSVGEVLLQGESLREFRDEVERLVTAGEGQGV